MAIQGLCYRSNSAMHKFTKRYTSHTTYFVSYAFNTIPILPNFKFKEFLILSFLCMHACMNQSCLLLLFTNIIDEAELCYSLIS